MYRTGDWSAYDLVKYLASIRKELTSEEMARLAQTQAFLAEDSSASSTSASSTAKEKHPDSNAANMAPKYMAGELYEPSDANRTLGLPVLAWSRTVRWRSNSPEGTSITSPSTIHRAMMLNLYHSDVSL